MATYSQRISKNIAVYTNNTTKSNKSSLAEYFSLEKEYIPYPGSYKTIIQR